MSGIEGNFRTTCELVMSVLRESRDSLVAMLEAFVHDPLVSWKLLGTQTRQGSQQDGDAAMNINPDHSNNASSNHHLFTSEGGLAPIGSPAQVQPQPQPHLDMENPTLERIPMQRVPSPVPGVLPRAGPAGGGGGGGGNGAAMAPGDRPAPNLKPPPPRTPRLGPMNAGQRGNRPGYVPRNGRMNVPGGGPISIPGNISGNGPMNIPNNSPMNGPTNGPMNIPNNGPMNVPGHGLVNLPDKGPMHVSGSGVVNFPEVRAMHVPVNGPMNGPGNGPMNDPVVVPGNGPMNGPGHGFMNGPGNGPGNGLGHGWSAPEDRVGAAPGGIVHEGVAAEDMTGAGHGGYHLGLGLPPAQGTGEVGEPGWIRPAPGGMGVGVGPPGGVQGFDGRGLRHPEEPGNGYASRGGIGFTGISHAIPPVRVTRGGASVARPSLPQGMTPLQPVPEFGQGLGWRESEEDGEEESTPPLHVAPPPLALPAQPQASTFVPQLVPQCVNHNHGQNQRDQFHKQEAARPDERPSSPLPAPQLPVPQMPVPRMPAAMQPQANNTFAPQLVPQFVNQQHLQLDTSWPSLPVAKVETGAKVPDGQAARPPKVAYHGRTDPEQVWQQQQQQQQEHRPEEEFRGISSVYGGGERGIEAGTSASTARAIEAPAGTLLPPLNVSETSTTVLPQAVRLDPDFAPDTSVYAAPLQGVSIARNGPSLAANEATPQIDPTVNGDEDEVGVSGAEEEVSALTGKELAADGGGETKLERAPVLRYEGE